MRVSKFYAINSNPLLPVEDLLLGYRYCTEEGHIVRIVNLDEPKGIIDIEIVQRSEMVPGELITGLDRKLLKLFWTLMRNRVGRVGGTDEDDSD